MAQEPSSNSSQEVAETSPAGSTESGLASSPSRRPVAAAAAAAAQSPSSESTARTDYTLPATKPAPRPKRTYGKAQQLPTAPPTAAPASIAPAAPPRPTLKETTSVVIPETDPNAPLASEPAFAHSPEDRVKKPVLAASSSSQTPASQHTTDPTSEEEVGGKSKRPARTLLDANEDAESDSSSDDAEADGDDGGMAAFLKNKITLKDLDAAVDELEPAAEKPPPAESSSLPPLTPSTEGAAQAVNPSSEATPVRASHDQQPTQDAPPSVEVVPTRPQAAPSPPPRRRRRAIESDESDQEVIHDKKAAPAHGNAQLPTPAATAPPHKSTKERLKLLAEKRRRETSETKRRQSAVAEEPEGAAAEEDDKLEEEPEDVVDEVDAIMNEASTGKKGRNGLISRKRKSKGLTKKEQEDMEKTAAAHARKVDVHLAATSRPALSVTEVFKKVPLAAPPPSPVRYIVGRASTPQTARPVIDLLTTSSSDSIENPDNDPAPTTPAYALKNAAASSKRSPRSDDIDVTPMPLRTLPTSFRPIGKTAKPGPAKKAAEPVVAVADDDEEGLEEFDLGAELVRSREQEERARKEQEKEEKRRKLAERKQAAIRASRSKAPAARATEDSDSDLDIEGAPSTKKGVRPSRRSRSPSAAADTLAQFASRKQSSPKRTAALNELLRFARASSEHPLSDDVEPSESQFKAAGKTFGANLDPNKRYLIGPKNRRQQAPVTVTQDINNEHLQRKMREQNAKERAKKQRNYRQMEQTRENEPKELESVNVDAMVKAKKEREEEDEKMEEEEDGDYVDEDDGGEEYNSADIGSDGDGEDDVGSESDVPVAQGRVAQPAPQNLDDDDLFDSEGEPVLPKSSQNDDRLGKAPDARDAFSDAEDEDDDSMLPPAFSRKARKAARIVDDEEEAQEEEDFAAVAAASGASLEAVTPKKTRVELGGLLGDVGGDDGGFSQFFNSQFSPGGDGASVGGFLRRDDEVFEPPAPTMFAVQPLISTAERAKDAARLEARGGFNDLAPATPREVAAPRQYINEKGLLTQTRPAANFDSPSDTPLRSHRQTYSTLDSQSQAMEETQLASAQTPTQITQRATASQRPNALRRTEALSNLESVAEVAPTEVAATEVVATADDPETQIEETQPDADTQDESQDIRPLAAQISAPDAPANAFELMRSAAARKPELEVARPPKGRGGNRFVEDEANLSEEEGDRVFGGVSDDENEDDHDQELAALVDNTKEDEEVEAEQDEEAARLHREKEAEAEKEALARAQRIADGKERNKRGRNELSDDDFDDDYARSNRREKQARVVVETVADLKANDDTRGFGDVLEKACVPETHETSWLNETQEESADEDAEMDAAPSDVFGSKGARINPYDVRAEVINRQRERNDAGDSAEDAESMLDEHFSLPGFSPSSPSRDIEINDRLQSTSSTVSKKKKVDHIDSQSLYSSTTAEVQYSAVGGDESQSMSAAVTSSRSAITSFKRTEKSKSQAAIGGTSNKAKVKGTPLAAKPSRLGNWRKRDAA